MKRINIVAAARRELREQIVHYDEQAPGLGARFVAATEEATARAAAFPLAGSPITSNTRRVFLKDFPFAMIYRPDDDGITVFAFAHHARRPDYWQSRVCSG